MYTFRDFSGRNIGAAVREERPTNLQQLRRAVLAAEVDGLPIHAMGSRWAFSAPAYCPGVVVETASLDGFPAALQAAIRPQPGRILAAVHSGIKVRNLNLALSGEPRADGGSPVPDEVRRGRTLVVPTLGGAGGQSLAGVVSTGTHGGDVVRPPICDYVWAMVVIGSGGIVRVFERQPGLIDVARLHAGYRHELDGTEITADPDPDAFHAALVSLGRFGIVYAYVVEVHDETSQFVYELRERRTWLQVKADLANLIRAGAAADGFLQVALDPLPPDAERPAFVTRHVTARDNRVRTASTLFGAGPAHASVPVVPERTPDRLMRDLGQIFCARQLNEELRRLADVLDGLAFLIAARHFPAGAIIAAPLLRAAASIRRIGPDHRLGDAVADVLNLATAFGFPQVIEIVNAAVLNMGQNPNLPTPPLHASRGPWLVHGRRWEIADIFDYDNDCYRGDSVEVFFPADNDLAGKVDDLLGVFGRLRRERRIAVGAYVTLRFLAPSRSLLATAAFSPSCAVEIAMLRGLEGNLRVLEEVQERTLALGGRIHWGQRNDMTASQVRNSFGQGLVTWKRKLLDIERGSITFSTPFTIQKDLEVDTPDVWTGWSETGATAIRSSPGVVSAGRDRPLEVFVQGGDGNIWHCARGPGGALGGWSRVLTDPVASDAAPVAVRGGDGRIELFVRHRSERIAHSYQHGPGGPWDPWDFKGGPFGPTIEGDPAVGVHADGRLEVFARGGSTELRRIIHCWQHGTFVTAWSAPVVRSETALRPPSVCLRRHQEGVSVSDQLIVVSADDGGEGSVRCMAQHGPGGDSGWTDWFQVRKPDEQPRFVGGSAPPMAVEIGGAGVRAHLFAVDGSGLVHESMEEDRTLAVSFSRWQTLPVPAPPDRLDPTTRLATVHSRRFWLLGRGRRGQVMAIGRVPGGAWGTWQNLGGRTAGAVSAGVADDGAVVVFARGNDDRLRVRQLPE